MAKRVRMVAEIVGERGTGCRLCEQVCPTVAITMRDRRDDEPGPGRRIADVEGAACYNAQTCFEICPDDAIEMRMLPEPFDVELDRAKVDEAAVTALCKKVGYGRSQPICFCTDTRAEEIAAAVLLGATAPQEISRMTGARTGCVELCLQPVIDFVIAAGHGEKPKNPKNGFQWYGRSATLFEKLGPKGFPDEVVAAYPRFDLDRDGEIEAWPEGGLIHGDARERSLPSRPAPAAALSDVEQETAPRSREDARRRPARRRGAAGPGADARSPRAHLGPRPHVRPDGPQVIRERTRAVVAEMDWSKIESGRRVNLIANPHGFQLEGEAYVVMLEEVGTRSGPRRAPATCR